MLTPTHISEALRMFKRHMRVKTSGFKRYEGDAREICLQIVDDCWNKEQLFFQTSAGHFRQFWSRDFGICTEALLHLGHRQKVLETLDYALAKFHKAGQITTSITPKGKPFNFPNYATDSLPFLIRSLRLADAKQLIKGYRGFLESEIQSYYDSVLDPVLNLVRIDRHFSTMKDYAKRNSSTYSNSMVSMLNEDLSRLRLDNPFLEHDVRGTMMSELWNGEYFYDDLNKVKYPTGDANTFPFWTGTVNSKKQFRSCLSAMQAAEVDQPWPLKYAAKKLKEHDLHTIAFFAGDYERDTVWMHLGLCFLDVVKKFDRKLCAQYLEQYTALIEKHKNFLELYTKDGKPFKTPFYSADEGMLWAAKYVHLS